MRIMSTKELPTVIEGEKVRFTYSELSGRVLASVIDRLGRQIEVPAENMPRECRQITSALQFQALLNDSYVKTVRMDNGEPSLYLCQRLRGGGGNEEVADELQEQNLVENIMALVRPGLEELKGHNIKENAVLLVGKTGVGKSMLGNLLCEVSLYTVEKDLEFTLEAKNPIFAFSHSNTTSCTGCPGVHSPNAKHYTFIDTAGFDDTRLASQDIANAFFRKEALRDTKNMKFVFVARYGQVKDRDPAFVETLHSLLQFLGIATDSKVAEFSDEQYNRLERIADSLVLVITQVPPQENTKVRAFIKDKLRNYLGSGSALSPPAKRILEKLLADERWDVFSLPSPAGSITKASDEKLRILHLIERSACYLNKSDVNIQVTVNNKYQGMVQTTLLSYIEETKKHFATPLYNEITEHLGKFYNAVASEKALLKFQKKYHDSIASNEPRTLQELLGLIKFREEMFASGLLEEAKKHDENLNFLIRLLPQAEAKLFTGQRDWLKELEIREPLLQWDACLKEMMDPAKITFTKKVLRLQGYFPKTSQLLSELSKYKDFTEVELHGLHTVILDEDIRAEALRGCNVTIIAPRWEIRNDRVIDLSGASASMVYHQATSAAESGDSGVAGVAGQNGQSAGHFFGVGHTFSGIERLTIKANGGNGGAGQMGGSGRDGKDGKPAHAKLTFIKDRDDLHKREIVEATGWDFVGTPFHHGGNKYDTELRNYGKQGQAGGDAGIGGVGGHGGLAGSIEICSTNQIPIQFTTEEKAGAKGADGEAGDPGIGGRKGPDWTGVWHTRGGYCDWNGHEVCQPHHTDFGPRAVSGTKLTVKNTQGLQSVSAQSAIESMKKLYHYREFAIEQSNQLILEAIEQFRTTYDRLPKLSNKATVDTFFYECQQMEDLYTKILDKTKCLPLYRWMSERLASLQVPNIQSGDAALMQCLYTYTLSKIHQLNALKESRLIIDIRGYLKVVEDNIKQLHELDHATKVTFYEEQYLGEITDKIQQADFFIKTLSDDINNAGKDIDKQIQKLVDEIEAIKSQNSAKNKELLAKREELKALIQKRKILGALTITAQCIGCFFPPAGPIVAGVVAAGLTMINNPQAGTMLAGQALSSYCEGISAVIQKPELKLGDLHGAVLSRVRDLTIVNAALNVVDAPGKSEEEQIKAMEKVLRDINAQQKLLDTFKQQVLTSFAKSLHEIVDGASKLQQALKGMPKVSLEFSRLAVKREFENIKRGVKDVTKAFAGGEGFLTIINQMQEAIETTANIYDNIQEYEERRTLVRYLARLAAPTAQDARITAYRQKVQRNLILEQYGRAFAAVRQWAFPFASIYLGDAINLQQFIEAQTMDDFMKHIGQQLRLLQNKVKGSVAEINSAIDPVLWKGSFSKFMTCGPFYEWEYEKNKKEIIDLLKGKPTVLFADIKKMPVERAAVKCSRVELQLTSKDPNLRKELLEALRGVRLQLCHSGLSYYQYEGQLYLMSNDKGFNLGYQFGSDGNTPESSNEVYNKMQGGNFMLSPYTHWIAQLENGNALFDKFAKQLPNIEVHLVGQGQYVHTTKAKGKKLGQTQYEHNRIFTHAKASANVQATAASSMDNKDNASD